jgi:hypothetical protein
MKETRIRRHCKNHTPINEVCSECQVRRRQYNRDYDKKRKPRQLA